MHSINKILLFSLSLANYLTHTLIQKAPQKANINLNIPISMVETWTRLIIFDPDNFIKYLNRK